MTVSPLVEHAQSLPEPQGHTFGFVDTQPECDAFIHELNTAGFPDSTIQVLNGDDGIQLLRRMMAGSLWGESAEELLKLGEIELSHGHRAIIIASSDRDQAMVVANLSANHGGHAFFYFGELADVRLTR
jgi:hypothetical protein